LIIAGFVLSERRFLRRRASASAGPGPGPAALGQRPTEGVSPSRPFSSLPLFQGFFFFFYFDFSLAIWDADTPLSEITKDNGSLCGLQKANLGPVLVECTGQGLACEVCSVL